MLMTIRTFLIISRRRKSRTAPRPAAHSSSSHATETASPTNTEQLEIGNAGGPFFGQQDQHQWTSDDRQADHHREIHQNQSGQRLFQSPFQPAGSSWIVEKTGKVTRPTIPDNVCEGSILQGLGARKKSQVSCRKQLADNHQIDVVKYLVK